MSNAAQSAIKQPEPFTPGITKDMVRQHAFRIYADKLKHAELSLQDWVLAEKDLVKTLETQGTEEP